MSVNNLKEKMASFFDKAVAVEYPGDPTNTCIVTFPFKDRHNDLIQLSVMFEESGDYVIQDWNELVTDVLIETGNEQLDSVQNLIGNVYDIYGLHVNEDGVAQMIADDWDLFSGLMTFVQALIVIDSIPQFAKRRNEQ